MWEISHRSAEIMLKIKASVNLKRSPLEACRLLQISLVRSLSRRRYLVFKYSSHSMRNLLTLWSLRVFEGNKVKLGSRQNNRRSSHSKICPNRGSMSAAFILPFVKMSVYKLSKFFADSNWKTAEEDWIIARRTYSSADTSKNGWKGEERIGRSCQRYRNGIAYW